MRTPAVGLVTVVVLLLVSPVLAEDGVLHSYIPPAGYVPDAETAIRIAVAVWEPIYGKKQIESEKPYQATLKNGVWIVEGSLPDDALGGVAVAEISKSDGTILRVTHGR
jgi:hypothetical protein